MYLFMNEISIESNKSILEKKEQSSTVIRKVPLFYRE